MNSDLLKERDVYAEYEMSVPWLRRARAEGRGPAFLRVHRRMIRYRRADIEAFLEQRLISTVDSTRSSVRE